MTYPWGIIGRYVMAYLADLGAMLRFSGKVLISVPRRWRHLEDIVQQLYVLCILSLGIVVISGGFIGMVVSSQGHHTLVKFGASQDLGQLFVWEWRSETYIMKQQGHFFDVRTCA